MTTTTAGRPAVEHLDRGPLDRDELAATIAADIPAGSYVNLGIGQPTLVAAHFATRTSVADPRSTRSCISSPIGSDQH